MATFRTLKEGELDTWAAHCAGVFSGPTDTPDYFRNHFLLDPFKDQNAVFIAEEGGEIASTLRVFRREVFIAGQRVPMGGIGEVSTKAEHRKKGFSGALLRMAIEYMQREELCTSLLFTGSHRHYARYGWFSVPTRSVALDNAAALPEGDVLRPLEPGDLPAVREMHLTYAAQFDGCLVREHEDYWTDWMTFAWKVPHVVARGGEIVAYIDANWFEDRGIIAPLDYAALPGGPAIEVCMGALCEKMGWRGDLLRPCAIGKDQLGRFNENPGPMWRLNAPFTLNGATIDTAAKLMAALADTLFWRADGY